MDTYPESIADNASVVTMEFDAERARPAVLPACKRNAIVLIGVKKPKIGGLVVRKQRKTLEKERPIFFYMVTGDDVQKTPLFIGYTSNENMRKAAVQSSVQSKSHTKLHKYIQDRTDYQIMEHIVWLPECPMGVPHIMFEAMLCYFIYKYETYDTSDPTQPGCNVHKGINFEDNEHKFPDIVKNLEENGGVYRHTADLVAPDAAADALAEAMAGRTLSSIEQLQLVLNGVGTSDADVPLERAREDAVADKKHELAVCRGNQTDLGIAQYFRLSKFYRDAPGSLEGDGILLATQHWNQLGSLISTFDETGVTQVVRFYQHCALIVHKTLLVKVLHGGELSKFILVDEHTNTPLNQLPELASIRAALDAVIYNLKKRNAEMKIPEAHASYRSKMAWVKQDGWGETLETKIIRAEKILKEVQAPTPELRMELVGRLDVLKQRLAERTQGAGPVDPSTTGASA